LEYAESDIVSYAVMHLLLAGTSTLAATTNQRCLSLINDVRKFQA